MSLKDDSVKVEVLRLHNEGLSLRKIHAITGVHHSQVGRFLKKEVFQEWWAQNEKPIAAGQLYDHHANVERLTNTKFILTSAQNNTFVHRGFFQSLANMADELDAQLIVGTFSYNLSGFQNKVKGEADWFDPLIMPYILDKPAMLADDLLWCGELNILPTAVNPFSGLQSYAKGSSGIIPHAKVQLESIPTHKSQPCRMMYSTGAITQRNYIQKKAGQKASFHHIFGALFVEVDSNGDWFARQLIADSDTGSFYDLDSLYTPTGVEHGHRVEAINWGDLHSEKMDLQVYQESFMARDGTSMLDQLRPKYQFIHDALDFEARNHHNIKDPYFRFKHHLQGNDAVEGNIRKVCSILESLDREWCETVIVESNHDLALKRWLKEADYKSDPENAIYFLMLQLAMYQAIAEGKDDRFSIFEHAVKQMTPELKEMRFLREDDSFMICGEDGIECGQHSHNGANGSRGSVAVYQKLGTRYNIGHSHSAAIKDGVYQAGVSGKLDMGYNVGGSSWSHSHIVTYQNGKRAIVTLKNGKYRAKH